MTRLMGKGSDVTDGVTDGVTSCRHCGLPSRSEFCCFGCRLAHGLLAEVHDATRDRDDEDNQAPAWSPASAALFLRLGVGVFLSVNLMAVSGFSYAREVFGEAASGGAGYMAIAGLFSYLQMLFATGVLVLLGIPLLEDSWRRLRADGNLLVCLAVGAAYVLSVHNTILGRGSLYFDTMAGVLVMVTLGRLLEARARRQATSSSRALLELIPGRAFVERAPGIVEIDAADVRPGERVRVRPGEVIPVDGLVLEGSSHLQDSSLTGESRARQVGPGDQVLASATNRDGLLWLEAERTGDQRSIAQLGDLLEWARQSQPEIQRLADRLAAAFVPVVASIALAMLALHLVRGQIEQALLVPLSVLLISCPCAFGVAVPLATWSALRRCAAAGIAVAEASTLERAARVRQVIFDKTGTLTTFEAELRRVVANEPVDERQALAWAASLESASVHPIARALLDAAARRGIAPGRVEDARNEPGRGVLGRVEGRWLRLGNRRFVEECGFELEGSAPGPYLMSEDGVLARFDLVESLHPSAERTVRELERQGLALSILTGDEAEPASELGQRLGVTVSSQMLPEDKLTALHAQRRRYGPVAVVGDGLNDGPMLGAADVGVAVASANDLAKSAGNVRLMGDDLTRIPFFFSLARHAVSRMRVGLGWAFAYNTIGIFLAASGRLSPVFAASAMVISSLIVVVLARGAGATEEHPAELSEVANHTKELVWQP